jgi:hypothetical protein
MARLFPLGVCPHDHDCGWQPARKRGSEPLGGDLLEYLLKIAGD